MATAAALVHGGVLTTLLDTALGLASSDAQGGHQQATIGLNVQFLAPVRVGDFITVECEGRQSHPHADVHARHVARRRKYLRHHARNVENLAALKMRRVGPVVMLGLAASKAARTAKLN